MSGELIQLPRKCFCGMFPLKGEAHHATHPGGAQWSHTRTRCGPEKKAHAHMAPSKAHRWIPCPGSLLISDADPETEWAAEGTRKHAVLYSVLKGDPIIAGDHLMTEAGEYKVPKEVIEQCMDIKEFIEQWRQLDGSLTVERETRVEIGSYYWPNVPRGMCDGTVDAAAYNGTELLVLDGKFGFVRVEARDNPQLYLYALGLLAELSYLPIERVTVCIAQPGWDGEVEYREHRISADELRQWAFDQTYVVAEIVEGSRRIFADDHACRYCPARTHCPARLEAVSNFAMDEWVEAHKLEELLPFVPRLRAICNDLEQKAIEQLNAGHPVHGWKMVESRSKRRWLDEEAVPAAVVKAVGVECPDIYEKKLMSPAKVEKALKEAGLKKQDREAVVNSLAFTPTGGPKLAPASDPRPALQASTFTVEDVLQFSLEDGHGD